MIKDSVNRVEMPLYALINKFVVIFLLVLGNLEGNVVYEEKKLMVMRKFLLWLFAPDPFQITFLNIVTCKICGKKTLSLII